MRTPRWACCVRPFRGERIDLGGCGAVLKCVEREGVTLTLTRRAGSGRPVLIVPGVMADAAGWQPVVDALDVAGPVYVLNRRGRRPSGALGPDYTLRTEIDDVVHVLDAIVAAEGTGQGVDLFGWSFGGLVALESAAQRLEAVHSLTLYEPVVRPFGHHAIEALQRAAAADDLDRAVEIVNRDVSGFTAEYVARLRRSDAWEVLRPLAAPLARELTALNEHPTELEALGALDVPVTLLLGAANEGVPPYGDVFARIASALPRASVVVMPGQGHLAHVQDPESLARHIGQALDRAGRGARETDASLS
ncbi:alpha/beta fold hydrolase [Streptomyces sp. NPDC055721]|uniref:alpha/beta fold hydrolase n=1 Tax=Streptomyces sp. NPDC127132 TaxID=3345374 RepID=UPI00363CC7ED